MKLIPKDGRRFIPGLIALAVPVFFQNLLSTGVSVADNAMVGVLGETALSSVTVANKVFFVFTLFLVGAASASTVIISQYWGKGDEPTVRRLFWLSVIVSLVIGVLFTAVCVFWPEAAMSIYTNDPALIEQGARYLRLIAPANIPFAVTYLLIYSLRGVERVKIGLWLSAAALAVNIFLNWVLIYGKLGFPAMGVAGAALATTIARSVQFVLMIVYLARDREKLIRFAELPRITGALTRSFLHEMAPILTNECLWGIGSSLYMVAIGRMGTDAVSAYSMISAFTELMTIAGMGLGHGVSVMIGMAMGCGRRDEAMTLARLSVALGFLAGLVFAGLTGLLFPLYMRFYNVSAEALYYAGIMRWIMMLHVLMCMLNFICIVGVLRGGGDGRTAMFIDLMILWPVSLPLSFLGAFVFSWPVYLIYGCVVLDELLKFIFASRRVFSGKWMRNLTKEF